MRVSVEDVTDDQIMRYAVIIAVDPNNSDFRQELHRQTRPFGTSTTPAIPEDDLEIEIDSTIKALGTGPFDSSGLVALLLSLQRRVSELKQQK